MFRVGQLARQLQRGQRRTMAGGYKLKKNFYAEVRRFLFL